MDKNSRKNRRRPTFINIDIVNASTTQEGPGRVDCIEMMAQRPTFPDAEN